MSKDKICYNDSEKFYFNEMTFLAIQDFGASALIIHESFVCTNKFNTRKNPANKWSTITGSISTLCKAELKIKLSKLNATVHIFSPFYVTRQMTSKQAKCNWSIACQKAFDAIKSLFLEKRYFPIQISINLLLSKPM